MFLHNISYEKFHTYCDDTLLNPNPELPREYCDVIVSNPPYSLKWDGPDNPAIENDPRFTVAGGAFALKSKADLAFVMHSLAYLNSSGTAAIVCFPGVMYRGGAEQKIRKYLIDEDVVDYIIALPPNLFFGTSIATDILVLKKGKKDSNILFIDASKEFEKAKNNNILSEENIKHIVDAYTKRENIEYFAQLITHKMIEDNNYNLSPQLYVEPEDTREKIDIDDLNKELDDIVAREDELRTQINKIIASINNEK